MVKSNLHFFKKNLGFQTSLFLDFAILTQIWSFYHAFDFLVQTTTIVIRIGLEIELFNLSFAIWLVQLVEPRVQNSLNKIGYITNHNDKDSSVIELLHNMFQPHCPPIFTIIHFISLPIGLPPLPHADTYDQ